MEKKQQKNSITLSVLEKHLEKHADVFILKNLIDSVAYF